MSASVALVGGVVVLVVVLILIVVSRTRRAHDGVDSFRRQIDALSPEARRPVIDQIYQSNDRADQRIDPRIDPVRSEPDRSATSGQPDEADEAPDVSDVSTDGDGAGEDGVHGT